VFAEVIEKGATVFDIGCGNGSTLKYLIEKKDIKGEGVDLSQDAVDMANSKGVKASVVDVTSEDFEITKEYDYIIISEMLEHISAPEDLMNKVRGKFRKALIISIPNTGHYIHRLRLLFGRFPVQWAYHPGEHLRFWTVRDFKKWSGDLGFKVISLRTHCGVPLLKKFLPGLFANSIVYVLEEKKQGISE
jgi:methionine biosynthesis protein MetW